MVEETADEVIDVELRNGDKYKIKSVSGETMFDWYNSLKEKNVPMDDNKALATEKLRFFVVKPEIQANTLRTMKSMVVTELLNHIDYHNGLGVFTPGRGNSQGPTAGKGTTN